MISPEMKADGIKETARQYAEQRTQQDVKPQKQLPTEEELLEWLSAGTITQEQYTNLRRAILSRVLERGISTFENQPPTNH